MPILVSASYPMLRTVLHLKLPQRPSHHHTRSLHLHPHPPRSTATNTSSLSSSQDMHGTETFPVALLFPPYITAKLPLTANSRIHGKVSWLRIAVVEEVSLEPMKHSAFGCVVMRALINGRNNGDRRGTAVTPFVVAEVRRRCVVAGGGWNGGLLCSWKRMMASEALRTQVTEKERKNEEKKSDSNSVVASSYWGISRPKITREDGTEWPWNCFMPWETYHSNLSIDLTKHHVPKNFLDKVAYRTVKLLRIPTDIFFKRRYGCRAMMLETVAAVPGMVGGMLLHLRSLRKFQGSGGWIKALLEEAENERMHLMTMVELVKPSWYERLLVLAVQGVFFNAFFVLYILSPKVAHRVVGYLEEEAIHSYTEYLKDIDSGAIENVAAPAIAIDYWRLPKDAKLKDVITVIRADEAHHRDVNHFASDIHFQGKELREAPAPLGYH